MLANFLGYILGGKLMKLVVLHGQQHHGSTWNTTQLLLKELVTNQDSLSEFYVNDIPYCIGCYTCILKEEENCPHRKVTKEIIHSIEQADVIIIDSPNYCMGMTGQLKTFFDHMAYRWFSHRPLGNMQHKIGIAIATTAGMGAKSATKQLKKQLFWWGIPRIFCINATVAAANWNDVKPKTKDKLLLKTKKIAKKIKRKHGHVKRGIRQKIIFKLMGNMQRAGLGTPKDASYWKEQGWI